MAHSLFLILNVCLKKGSGQLMVYYIQRNKQAVNLSELVQSRLSHDCRKEKESSILTFQKERVYRAANPPQGQRQASVHHSDSC